MTKLFCEEVKEKANKTKGKLIRNGEKGISMITLVITIIVMLILLGVVFGDQIGSIDEASRADFFHEVSAVKTHTSERRFANQIHGTGEEIENAGFYKTKILNPPDNFVSFKNDVIYGYVVDLEYIEIDDEAKRGLDYKRYSTDIANNVVKFGEDDVYIYDKDGNMFYAGGFITNDGIYYSPDKLEKLGPEIISVVKNVAGNKKSVTIEIVVRKIENGTLTVKVGDEEASRISAPGKEETFEITVYENKTYKIKATEEKQGSTMSSVDVTEIDAETYEIRYDANGGSNPPASQTKTENVVMKITTERPQRSGYTFIGWNENSSETVATYVPESEFTLNRNAVLYAIWQPGEEINRTYSVTYNANGGTGAPAREENIKGDYTIQSVAPTREGYGFEGWSEDAKATTATYKPGDQMTVNKNVELYAVWTRGTKTVLVTVDPEGAGTVTGNGARLTGGEVFVSTTPAQGYTFKNWTVAQGGINLSNTTTTNTTFTMPDNDVELVAHYEINGLTVKYNGNKGTIRLNPEVVQYGEETIITTIEPTRHGYDFMGWSLNKHATEPSYKGGDTYEVLQNTVFYAIWAPHVNTYTLTFDMNGGTGSKDGGFGIFTPQVKTEGGILTIPEGGVDEPYKKDFTFKGWALTADAEEEEVVLQPGDIYYRDADLTLYAVWKDEIAPTINLVVEQEEGTDKLKIKATTHDEGLIAGYAWTMTDTMPTVWQVDGIGGKDLTKEKLIEQKGKHYFWAKDVAGNYAMKNIMVYEIKFDANGGTGAPATQFQAENIELTLSSQAPTKDRYTFLGWSTSVNPGNTEASVNYLKGGKIKLNSDVTLRAVWGEAFFRLSSNTAITQIDGPNVQITVTKSLYTGNITVTSEDPAIATATENNNIITIVPGTKVGEVKLHVTEDREGTTETITVIVNKGQRALTIKETSKNFVYGDSAAQIGFSYRGKDSATTVSSSNTNVAVATLNGKSVTITPKNFGTAIITITIAEDDQYVEKRGEIAVTVSKREIIVTPTSNIKKVYDGTAVTPELKYSYTGNITGEVPGFTGTLGRTLGVDVGKYEINIGTLALVNNGSFKASNYRLSLSATKVYFEITPKPVTPPVADTPQEYDGTTKYGIPTGAEYTRGGQYAEINAGSYTAVATLRDTKNYMWSDTQNTTAKNIPWQITSKSLQDEKIKVGTVEGNSIGSYVYTGNAIKPVPTVTYDNTVSLVNGVDFTLSYANNINVGTATITITGKGNYQGTIQVTFKITKATMQVDASDYTGVFDNKSHTISVKATKPASGAVIYYSETQLSAGNYSTAGSTTPITRKNVGTTTIYYYIVNSNFFDHSGSKKVTITPKAIGTSITVSGIVDKKYTGSAITQNITVKETTQNRNLVAGTDYTVSYANNTNVGTATVTLTGKGNFNGTKTLNFKILGDTITISKSTNALVSSLTVSISKEIDVTALQYKIDNGSWTAYGGPITITKDCTVYGRSVHNGNTIGSNSITITNICEHSYSTVTCTTDSTCIYCGILNQSKLGHDFTSQTPTNTYLKTAANCLNKAVYYYKCIRCSERNNDTYEYGEPLNHDYTSKVTTSTYQKSAATCTEAATYYYKCSRCDSKSTDYYSNGNPLGHNFTSQTITATYFRADATCESPATYYYKCSRCNEKGTDYYTYGNAKGHDFTVQDTSSTYKRSDATCTAAATYYYKCSRCTAKDTKYYSSGNSLGHSFTVKSQEETYLKTAANCTANAVYYYKCSRCSEHGTDTYAVSGTALGHTYGEYSILISATCTRAGTKIRYCQRCGVSQEASIDILAHSYTAGSSSERTAATCTDAATYWYKCSGCSSVSTSKYYSSGNPLGHNYASATCTKAATCTRCSATSGGPLGHNFSARTCTAGEVCSRCSATGEGPLGHTYGGWTIIYDAGCTSTGRKEHYCVRCNKMEYTTIPVTGHAFNSYSQVSAGTCVECAQLKSTCANGCGSTSTQSGSMDFNNHVGPFIDHIISNATCTSSGRVDIQCDACGVYTGYRTLPKTDHNYADATCTAPQTCKNCGGTTGSSLGHDFAAATCTAPETCNRCGATGDGALGHKYGSWTTTKAATCTATGSKKRTCSRCGAKDTETIAKTSHSYNSYYSSNSSKHWKQCKTCTAKISEGSHNKQLHDPVNCFYQCTICDYEQYY